MDNDKRFIEDTFPVKEVSAESAREKRIHSRHISSMHIWWARRPLASSRATNYAALIPAISRKENPEEWNRKRDFISKFAKWENSLDQTLIDKARKEILDANGGKPPKVLDPFAGGGAIPLEALRLGCETYASDYNPVAVLIEKCTIEYPQKYAKPGEVEREVEEFGRKRKIKAKVDNKLLEDVKKWGNWVFEKVKKEIDDFYPIDENGSIPVSYIWARTLPCQNPSCHAEIPLMRQFWLAKKLKKKVALCPCINGNQVNLKIIGDGYTKAPPNFDPTNGTISRAVVSCPCCNSVIDNKTTRRLFMGDKAGQRMMVVVLIKPGETGKKYRITTDKDITAYKKAQDCLVEKEKQLKAKWGMDPIPDELISDTMPGALHTPTYGLNTWGSLFNLRQKLAILTFTEKIRTAHHKMIEEGISNEYAKAIVSYLGLGLGRIVNRTSQQSVWNVLAEKAEQVFLRQALPMLWDYCEINCLANQGWNKQFWYTTQALENLPRSDIPTTVIQCSATALTYEDNFFDAVFTDPPYYYSVTYADLSDFFYVWLKRAIGDLYPDLFSTPLTPKTNEIIEKTFWDKTSHQDSTWYEEMLRKALKEIYRVLKENGIATVVYAHRTTKGWETLINALLDSGLVITASWPIHTEMKGRMMAQKSAALASSIYIVARKMQRQPTGFYKKVQEDLKKHIDTKLEGLWQEGIGGADFFIAAIGSAIEVFGKYEKVMDYEGNIVRADRLLEDVRKIATDYAVRQILHNGFGGEISDLTKFYVLWRWNYRGAKVEFDEANKLARSCGIDLAREWNRPGFIKKEKEFIKLLGPQDRKLDQLTDSTELIDILHEVLLLWEKSKRDEIKNTLGESGYGTSEAFYRVAQAISETLPIENKEKKLLDGFLAGKERIKDEIKQGRLFK